MYREDPDWADVVPLPQQDASTRTVQIAYKDEYVEAMDYFRAISKRNEVSPRVLRLLTDLAHMNPAHYTLWAYRQRVLVELYGEPNHDAEWEKEWAFLDEMLRNNLKNYQLWRHRQFLMERTKRTAGEAGILDQIFDLDAKNYHAWAYRQWFVQTFNLWENELSTTRSYINQDIRNNSAWNHRFFVFKRHPSFHTQELIMKEMELIEQAILETPNNESPWSYARGMISLPSTTDSPETASWADTLRQKLQGVCTALQESGRNSIFSLEWLMDVAIEGKQYDRAVELTTLLIEMDPIREKYWTWRQKCLLQP